MSIYFSGLNLDIDPVTKLPILVKLAIGIPCSSEMFTFNPTFPRLAMSELYFPIKHSFFYLIRVDAVFDF